jgi:ABC-type multidrug transport system fused ATPase/permease subunit
MSSIRPGNLLATVRHLGLPRRTFVYLFLLNLLGAGLDLLGVVLLLPILEIIQAGGGSAIDKLQGQHWTILRNVSAQIGIPISLGLLLLISFTFVLARQFIRYFAVRYAETVQRNMANSIRARIFARFLRAETVSQDAASVGSVVSILQSDLRRALDVLLSITQSVSLFAQIIAYFFGLFLLSPIMCLVCAVLMLLVMLASGGQFREIMKRGDAMTNVNQALATFTIGRLRRARLIRLSGTEKAEANEFRKITTNLAEQELQQKMLATRVQFMIEPGVIAAAYLLFFLGAQVLGMSLERLGLFAILLIKILPPLRNSLAQYGRIVGMLPSLERVRGFLQEITQAAESKGGPLKFKRLDSGIRFSGVSFSYRSSNSQRRVCAARSRLFRKVRKCSIFRLRIISATGKKTRPMRRSAALRNSPGRWNLSSACRKASKHCLAMVAADCRADNASGWILRGRWCDRHPS